MGKKLLFALLVLAIVVSEQALAKKLTVNIWAGSPTAGFGDVAANVLMAERLRALNPDWEIRILYAGGATPKLGVLLGEAIAEKQSSTSRGIRFLNLEKAKVPKADVYLEFGLTQKSDAQTPPEVRTSAPVGLQFTEYGSTVDGHAISQTETAEARTRKYDQVSSEQFEIQTGVEKKLAGLYLNSTPPKPPMSVSQLEAWLKENASFQGTLKNKHLGFSYTDMKRSSEMYIAAIDAAKRRGKWNGEKITLISRYPPAKDLSLHPDIEVVVVPSTPLKIPQTLASMADIPPMVTGDCSLTLFLERGKPFFYESQSWKGTFISSLIERFLNRKDGPLSWRSLSEEGGLPTLEQLERILSIKPFGDEMDRKLGTESLTAALMDDKLMRNFADEIEHLRGEISLPENLSRFLNNATTEDFKRLSLEQIQELFDAAKQAKSAEAAAELFSQSRANWERSPSNTGGAQAATPKPFDPENVANNLLALHPMQRRKSAEALGQLPDDQYKAVLSALEKSGDPQIRALMDSIPKCREVLAELRRK